MLYIKIHTYTMHTNGHSYSVNIIILKYCPVYTDVFIVTRLGHWHVVWVTGAILPWYTNNYDVTSQIVSWRPRMLTVKNTQNIPYFSHQPGHLLFHSICVGPHSGPALCLLHSAVQNVNKWHLRPTGW